MPHEHVSGQAGPIVLEPMYFTAECHAKGNALFLSVYASPVVEETDPYWQPVHEFLAQRCHAKSFERIVEDETMIGYQATEIEYEIYEGCSQSSHVCPRVLYMDSYPRKEAIV